MTTMLAWLWQGMAIAVGTAVLLRCMPRLNAATRYVVWWMALGAVLSLPVAHLLLANGTTGASVDPGLRAGRAAAEALVLPRPPDWLIAGLTGIWLGTVLLGFGRIACGFAAMAALRQRSRPLDPSRRRRLTYWCHRRATVRAAELRVSREIAGACALGLFGPPVIVVSERLVATLADEAIDQIVLHEQAHLSRYDDWTTLAQRIVRALLGLHPAIRIIDARIDLEREATCDDLVVMSTGGAARYARCLAEAADAVAGNSRQLALLTPNATGRGGLLVRVQRLLDPRVPRHVRLQAATAAAVFVAFAGAAAAGTTVPLITIADAISRLPGVRGEPAHRFIDWEARAAVSLRPPVTAMDLRPEQKDVRAIVSRNIVARPFVVDPEGPMADGQLSVAPLFADSIAESSDDPFRSEPAPLQSRALPSAVVPAAARSTDTQGTAWQSAGQAGAAVGEGFARMGSAAGAGTKRAGVALGGFFSRAGKAVADGF